MGDDGLTKKIDKLESKADELTARAEELREKAAEKAGELSDSASERVDQLQEKAADMAEEDDSGGKKGLLALILAALAGVGLYFKKKREQELDEALWEEPRSL